MIEAEPPVRPWKSRWKLTNPMRPVAARATRIAPSTASVPDEKNVNRLRPGGVTDSSASIARTLNGVAKSWTLSSSLAARAIASATTGWACPRLVMTMPDEKSMYVLPSTSVSVTPRPRS